MSEGFERDKFTKGVFMIEQIENNFPLNLNVSVNKKEPLQGLCSVFELKPVLKTVSDFYGL